VNDLVEGYAGDTDTFGMHKDENKKSDKGRREAEAFERLERELGKTFPWIINTIREYESLESREARFVKTLDKLTPKITHGLNSGVAVSSLEAFEEHCDHQLRKLRETYGADQEVVLDLYAALVEKVSVILAATPTNEP